MEGNGSNQPPVSKDLLYSGDDEKSKLFIADGKDRIHPRPPEITRVPASSVLAKARTFLPMMAAANAQLQQAMATNPESVNIENVEEGKPYVQMKLSFLGEEPAEGERYSSNSDEDSSEEDSSDGEGDLGEEMQTESKDSETSATSKRRRIIEEIGGHENEEEKTDDTQRNTNMDSS